MSAILISDVLQYFSRDDLEILSSTSRFIQRLIEHEFPSKPFRIFDQLSISASHGEDLKLRLINGYALLLQDHSNIEEFKDRISHSEELDNSTCFQIDEIQPFLGLNVRIKETIIWLLPYHNVTSYHLSAMEKISHLWIDRCLQINSFAGHENSGIIAKNCDLIFSFPNIVSKCGQLSIWGIDMPFSDYPNLYHPKIVKFIRFMTSQITPSHLLDFVKGIDANRSKAFIFFELTDDFVQTHIEKIRRDFESANASVTFKVFFMRPENALGDFCFHDENKDTKEILELRVAVESDFSYLLRHSDYDFAAPNEIFCLERKLM